MSNQPNILYVFADQWRQQAFGYAGDPNVKTPHIDRFARENINFEQAVSGCPVCVPHRGSLMTGVYPHRHGLMVNDQCLYERYDGPFLAECLRDGGYDTAYIGKWHIDGQGRNCFVPPERRLGFEHWQGFECTHDYLDSYYYAGDDPRPHPWKGYDADAQTDAACDYMREHTGEKPFALFLSWGPPHNPYETAPAKYQAMYRPEDLELRPNVPAECEQQAREELAGYYAHCTALDDAFARLLDAVDDVGLADNTIVIFTSDHGDMHGSQGGFRKQRPWAESVRVPFLVRHPAAPEPRVEQTPIDTPDMMPTLLSLAGITPPENVHGTDFSETLLTGTPSSITHAMLSLYMPFHEWRYENGGRAYRGLQDAKYTYIRALDGPWLLYDNAKDPYQQNNLVDDPAYAETRDQLDTALMRRLDAIGDDFAPGPDIIERENYAVDAAGNLTYENGELPTPYPE